MKRLVFGLILLLLVTGLFFNRVKIKNAYVDGVRESVPLAVNIDDVEINMIDSIPEEYNLSVPFMVQAPDANWDLPYQEACEEATIIMLHYYIEGKELDKELADKEILDLVKWQNDYFGYYKDTTVAETAEIAKEYLNYDVEIIDNPTVDMIKKQIVNGRPVIAPFYGKALGNPYYSGDGPLYHMMVIKGYTDTKFITNDPGTKMGQNYMYDYEVIMSAMHDWNYGDVENGQRSIFVVR